MNPTLPAAQEGETPWDDKFDKIVRWYNSPDPNAKLPANLAEQLERWNYIHALITTPKNQFRQDSAIIRAIRQRFPELAERTARHALRDTRRFFGNVEDFDQAFEKNVLISHAKDMLRRALIKGDMKAEGVAMKMLIEMQGANQPSGDKDNRTVINILNYNPAELGGKLIPEEKLQQMIQTMLEKDQKRQENPFDDYTDLTDEPTPAP